MNEHEMVPLIVLIAMTGAVFMTWIKSKEKRERNAALSKGDQARIDALEERVKVLERLVTDQPSRLAQEIDAL